MQKSDNKRIGIIGSGIAGLHLGLLLRQHGVQATIYSDRTPAQIRAGRLPATVARFEHTRARERALGINYWDIPEIELGSIYLSIQGTPPLAFRGDLSRPINLVDMRLYYAILLNDFVARGGQLVVGTWQADDVTRLAADHDLMVVASGRGSVAELFPRVPERSPYTEPQRRLCAGLFHGIEPTEPLGMSYNISPGHGEIFAARLYTFDGPVGNLLFEAIPGQGIDVVTRMRYEDDPTAFEATVLEMLRVHAPSVYERVDPERFRLTRPLDLLQGALTPVVRQGYIQLPNDKLAMAIGDAHVVNDPVLGQGANAASHAGWVLGDAILAADAFDETFCREVEQRIWQYVQPVTEWTNAALQPPPPHAVDVFVAAAHDKDVADQIVDNFNTPQRNWEIFGSPEGAAAFLEKHGRRAAATIALDA